MSDIKISDHGPVRVLTINRPERRNALAATTAEELRTAVEDAARASGVGALVLTGAGGHFSAGGDAEAILGVIGDNADAAPVRLMRTFHRLVQAIWDSELPVVAAVSGVAYGGAFNLALSCDLIYCSEDARFCQVFMKRGIVPDVGGAYLLPRAAGIHKAKELMLLAGEIDAQRASDLGLVNGVLPDAEAVLARAIEIATQIAESPDFAVSLTKRLINSSTTGTLQSALELEAITQATILRSPSAQRGFQEFLNRGSRTPDTPSRTD
ncbi:enoyl-CoA hydratase [Antricoccus suffuscus]|uniref:Enoyl-CoA hydratase n=1 Tax=Antricoccus suffuscus TaxID=1629062 RepID=A0A2T1A0D4_9ACTN|nr:enoyl-CoA hydratase/isomerase family protein [Antricoccus suffuscus]PRZ42063.1 enoyl-CoA hydratase [Antricoccus suffuscus]